MQISCPLSSPTSCFQLFSLNLLCFRLARGICILAIFELIQARAVFDELQIAKQALLKIASVATTFTLNILTVLIEVQQQSRIDAVTQRYSQQTSNARRESEEVTSF